MKRDVSLDFMGISTYGKGKTSSGEVRVTKDLDISLEGADVVIVEDIVDSGVTLNYLLHVLEQRKPRSIRIAALLDKPERRLRPVHVSYVGFRDPRSVRRGIRSGFRGEVSESGRRLRGGIGRYDRGGLSCWHRSCIPPRLRHSVPSATIFADPY